jgi:uracil-DNA glycosylase
MSHKPVLIVGEAWGRQEAEERKPFVGASGSLLNQFLAYAGLDRREDCYLTNCFNFQPRPTNDIVHLCGPRKEGISWLPAVIPGKYIRKEFEPELDRLFREVELVKPNLIIALGNTALLALMKMKIPISKNRGNLFQTPSGTKLLATYHPAAVLRDMTMRPVVISDFKKAARHCRSPEFTRPAREIWIEPTLEDLKTFEERYIAPNLDLPWGVDIETAGDTITEIGFGTRQFGIVVPFYSRSAPDHNYWPDHNSELRAWTWVRHILHILRRPVFQNGLYDLTWLWKKAGITVPHAGEDTMLLTHALQPEMKKGLGFLASIHTDEPSWKMMRQHNETLKKEDD